MSLLLLFRPGSGITASPLLDDVFTGQNTAGSLTIPVTVASNSDRLLVVSISTQDSNHTNLPVVGVTFNGVALTRAHYKEHTRDVRAEEWYLIAPAAGTYNLVITTTGSVWIGAVASSWYNLNQSAQPHTIGDAIGSDAAPSASLTPLSNGTLIIDAISSESARSAVEAAQTTLGTDQGTSVENVAASYKILDTAANTTMSSTLGSSAWWAEVAVAYNPTATTLTAPTVTTEAASSIGISSATGNGTVTSTGGIDVLERGFQYNTVTYPNKEVSETGTFSAESFTLTISNLTPDTTYYYRAFARNAAGTMYGTWQSFTTGPATYNLSIDGVDRTADVINRSLVIDDVVNDQVNSCSFRLVDRSSSGIPDNAETVIITLDSGQILFAGTVVRVGLGSTKRTGYVEATIQCTDYTYELDGNLVHRTYENVTDKEIIEDVNTRYCAGKGFTTTNVIAAATIEQISFNYLQPSQVFRKLADLTGSNWYVDYEKDIHYFPLTTNPAPFNITESNNQFFDLNLSKDAKQIKNRVYVRGGTKLSDYTTYTEVGDGEKKQFVLPDKPHDVTVEVDRGSGFVEESLGIKNVDTSGYKWYLNYQEKYLEQDDSETVLSATDVLRVTYKYDIPILVAQENAASIAEHGVREFLIVDKSIETTNSARDRAAAELTDYANNIIEGTFQTYEPGFISGQYININHSGYDVNADYVVQKVTARSFGAGNYVYTISIASAKTMGIIRFLVELLEANRDLVQLDDNEVVDELLTLTDSLLNDSLLDSLVIDSAGPYATWCADSLDSSPTTRARWDLFQWG